MTTDTAGSGIEAKIARGELRLPTPFEFPKANRRACVRSGNLLFVSGHPPVAELSPVRGKIPGTLSEEDGYQCARSAALGLLASVRQELGSLDLIRRVVKVFGMVNSSPGFERQFAVIDGASDVFIELWGPTDGCHARSAVGMFELPRGYPVEIEAVFELHDVAADGARGPADTA